jgi:hypothetical protein
MKKESIVIVCLVMISILSVSFISAECIDSDNGIDYTQKGSIKLQNDYSSGEEFDKCTGINEGISELVCGSDECGYAIVYSTQERKDPKYMLVYDNGDCNQETSTGGYTYDCSVEDKICSEGKCVEKTVQKCIPDWECSDWTPCQKFRTSSMDFIFQQTRNCEDKNDCATMEAKPEEVQSCSNPCIEDWSCSEWSACSDDQKTRTCEDTRKCGTNWDEPLEINDCEETNCKKLYGTDSNNNIDLVFIPGDGYSNLTFFKNEVLSHIDIEGEQKGFFYYEPFKLLKSRFNVYIVTKEPSAYNTRSEYIAMMGEYCPEADLPILLQDHYPHTGQYKEPSCGIHENYDTIEKKNSVCVHEALGHGFGYLFDEYSFPIHPRIEGESESIIYEYPNIDIAGCPKWCDGDYAFDLSSYSNLCIEQITQEDCENVNLNGPDCVWVGDEGISYDYFKETSCLPQHDTINIGKNCIGNSGCYFGSNGYINIWRSSPENNQIMGAGSEYFSDANKEHLKNLIDCCHPSSCEDFDTQKCEQFSKTSVKFQGCNACGDIDGEILIPTTETGPIDLPETISSESEKELVCSGCVLSDKCYPFGYRKDGKYCLDEDSQFTEYKTNKETCENNFECNSNVCVDNQCIKQGLFKRFLRWLGRIF